MSLADLVIEHARRAPDTLAVAAPDASLSYGTLDRLAERYAAAMYARGVRAGSRVVIWSGKSTAAVAATQGALRIGAVYVPVTDSNPAARVARIATDCAAALVVADATAAERGRADGGDALLATAGIALAALDELIGGETRWDPATMRYQPGHDDPAYILYTSGSTGMPKGVVISHRNALAFVDWAVEALRIGPADRLSNHAPFNFDLSVFDLYAAFRAGASVHLVPTELAYAPRQLVEFIYDGRLTIWYSVPSALSLMVTEGGLLDQEAPPDLRACIFAGEPFTLTHAQTLRKAWPGVRMLNWYGPTETNVCTSYEMTDADLPRSRPLPIGTAASGDTVELDPPGGTGEIVVSGPTVMLGYWGRERHHGPYRTGDTGRAAPDGNLEYVGRQDHMVKVRGNRIELGEIEAALSADPMVRDVTVLVAGSGLDARLHAVIVPEPGARPSLLRLKRRCAEQLPLYMVVDELHLVDAIPITANGKKDRAAVLLTLEGS